MKCPACSYPEMTLQEKTETLEFGNRVVNLSGMRGEFCPSCGEGVWDAESYRRFTEAQAALVCAAKGDSESQHRLEDLQKVRVVAERKEEYHPSGSHVKKSQ